MSFCRKLSKRKKKPAQLEQKHPANGKTRLVFSLARVFKQSRRVVPSSIQSTALLFRWKKSCEGRVNFVVERLTGKNTLYRVQLARIADSRLSVITFSSGTAGLLTRKRVVVQARRNGNSVNLFASDSSKLAISRDFSFFLSFFIHIFFSVP